MLVLSNIRIVLRMASVSLGLVSQWASPIELPQIHNAINFYTRLVGCWGFTS